jgi:hypothetical protein
MLVENYQTYLDSYHKPDITRFNESMVCLTTTEDQVAFIQKEQEFTMLVHKVRSWYIL